METTNKITVKDIDKLIEDNYLMVIYEDDKARYVHGFIDIMKPLHQDLKYNIWLFRKITDRNLYEKIDKINGFIDINMHYKLLQIYNKNMKFYLIKDKNDLEKVLKETDVLDNIINKYKKGLCNFDDLINVFREIEEMKELLSYGMQFVIDNEDYIFVTYDEEESTAVCRDMKNSFYAALEIPKQ